MYFIMYVEKYDLDNLNIVYMLTSRDCIDTKFTSEIVTILGPP